MTWFDSVNDYDEGGDDANNHDDDDNDNKPHLRVRDKEREHSGDMGHEPLEEGEGHGEEEGPGADLLIVY